MDELNRYNLERVPELRIALVYPNEYHAGMSSYAVHLLYGMFNSVPKVRCERFFLPSKIRYPAYFQPQLEKREDYDDLYAELVNNSLKRAMAKTDGGINRSGLKTSESQTSESQTSEPQTPESQTSDSLDFINNLYSYNQLPDQKLMRSIETSTPLSKFDIIAFTIHYELDYLNLIWILESSGIPILNKDRTGKNKSFPLIIGGGPCFRTNPLFLLDILDLIVFHDFEPIFNDFMTILLKYREVLMNFNDYCNITPDITDKAQFEQFNSLIRELHSTPNILIARFAKDILVNNGEQNLVDFYSIGQFYPRPTIYMKEFDDEFFPTIQPTPLSKSDIEKLAFKNAYLIELNRGCPYGCRFCMTGYVNRPFRNRPFDRINKILNNIHIPENYDKITLIGSSIADYPNLEGLCGLILEKGFNISIPSLRVDKITSGLLNILKKGNVKTITIAPESGSFLLRKKVNKNITNEEIINKTVWLLKNNIDKIKMYFLIGLPFEDSGDIDEIGELCGNIIKLITSSRKADDLTKKGSKREYLHLNINFFIPKLLTPFAGYSGNYTDFSLAKLKKLKKRAEMLLNKIPGVSFNIMDPKEAQIQTVLSILDYRFTPFLLDFYYNGGKPGYLKKWNKDYGNLISTALNLQQQGFVDECASLDPFSRQIYSIIDVPINSDYIIEEIGKGRAGDLTQKCPADTFKCRRCGVCK